jgi:hypothetical protein
MAQHTLGPWTLDDPNGTYADKRGGHGFRPLRIIDKDGNQLAFCGDTTNKLADARLMAAAPDMLAALKWIATHALVHDSCRLMAQGVVTKATGAA